MMSNQATSNFVAPRPEPHHTLVVVRINKRFHDLYPVARWRDVRIAYRQLSLETGFFIQLDPMTNTEFCECPDIPITPAKTERSEWLEDFKLIVSTCLELMVEADSVHIRQQARDLLLRVTPGVKAHAQAKVVAS